MAVALNVRGHVRRRLSLIFEVYNRLDAKKMEESELTSEAK